MIYLFEKLDLFGILIFFAFLFWLYQFTHSNTLASMALSTFSITYCSFWRVEFNPRDEWSGLVLLFVYDNSDVYIGINVDLICQAFANETKLDRKTVTAERENNYELKVSLASSPAHAIATVSLHLCVCDVFKNSSQWRGWIFVVLSFSGCSKFLILDRLSRLIDVPLALRINSFFFTFFLTSLQRKGERGREGEEMDGWVRNGEKWHLDPQDFWNDEISVASQATNHSCLLSRSISTKFHNFRFDGSASSEKARCPSDRGSF